MCRRGIFLSIMLVLISTSLAKATSFQGLGGFGGNYLISTAYDVSADGKVVVGYGGLGYYNWPRIAFRWTQSGGMQGLGVLPGRDSSIATGVSSDGSVIVGESSIDTYPNSWEAFRWTQSGGMQGLGVMDCERDICNSSALGVSGDGLVVVGYCDPPDGGGGAFRWTLSGGLQDMGDPARFACDASYDGTVIVGSGEFFESLPNKWDAFLWKASDGFHQIGYPGSDAQSVSRNGLVVVGTCDEGAFRWTESDGIQLLGVTSDSIGYGISADGSVAVGASGGYGETYAFIWDTNNGMRNLNDVLESYGLDLTGWDLYEATAVSDDGLTIVGTGYNPSGSVEGFIATLTVIKGINDKKVKNMKDHHTESFNINDWNEPALILRRGGTFETVVNLTSGISYPLQICFKAEYFYNNNWFTIDIPFYDGEIPTDQWGTKRIGPENPDDPDVTMLINIPPNAAAGPYKFKALLKRADVNEPPLSEKYFPNHVGILFNPWNSTDSVYMHSNAERNEYVLNTNGLLWQGKADYMIFQEWSYDQFEEFSYYNVIYWLIGIEPSKRSDPIYVSRYFSAIVNSFDDNGIIEGKWYKPYTGGTDPLFWKGSGKILERYFNNANPVKYGQCWVFGGVLTSLLRSVGIPVRPITNYYSLHDKTPGVNKIYDYFETKDWDKLSPDYCSRCLEPADTFGYRMDKCQSDSIWYYHVWCEAWINRPDRPGFDGWQAVDGTPQERSDGIYRLGPAPVSAVKQNLGGNYDVNFVFAEVNTKEMNIWKYTVDVNGQMHDPIVPETIPTVTGQNISTKSIGSNNRNDITAFYKYTPPPTPSPLFSDGSDVEVIFDPPGLVNLGSDVVWTVYLENTSGENRTLTVGVLGKMTNYKGDLIVEADRISRIMNLNPSEANSVELVISESEYAYGLPETRFLKAAVRVVVNETGQEFFDPLQTTYLTSENIDITLVPDANLHPGESVTCEARWRNPLSITLHNVIVSYQVDNNFSINGKQVVDINVPDLPPGGEFFTSQEILGLKVGTGLVSVELHCDELEDVRGWAQISVIASADYNQDGIVNFIDFALFANVWQTIDPNYSLDEDENVDIDDLVLFTKDWLWMGSQTEQTMSKSGESYNSMAIEPTSIDKFVSESISEHQPTISEQIKQLREIIDWSEKLYLEDKEIRSEIDEEQWQEFMKILYKELETLKLRQRSD